MAGFQLRRITRARSAATIEKADAGHKRDLSGCDPRQASPDLSAYWISRDITLQPLRWFRDSSCATFCLLQEQEKLVGSDKNNMSSCRPPSSSRSSLLKPRSGSRGRCRAIHTGQRAPDELRRARIGRRLGRRLGRFAVIFSASSSVSESSSRCSTLPGLKRRRPIFNHLPELLRLRQRPSHVRRKFGISASLQRLQHRDCLIRLPVCQIEAGQIEQVILVARADRQCLSHRRERLGRIARSRTVRMPEAHKNRQNLDPG